MTTQPLPDRLRLAADNLSPLERMLVSALTPALYLLRVTKKDCPQNGGQDDAWVLTIQALQAALLAAESAAAPLPADWREDSSLETWFPLTAEKLDAVSAEAINHAERCNALRDGLKKIGTPDALRAIELDDLRCKDIHALNEIDRQEAAESAGKEKCVWKVRGPQAEFGCRGGITAPPIADVAEFVFCPFCARRIQWNVLAVPMEQQPEGGQA